MTLLSTGIAALARLPRGRHRRVVVERDQAVPMPDGVDLLADHWYPVGPDLRSVPVVLVRSPYGRRQLSILGRLFAERGYQVVVQSCRGTFGSGGRWDPFRHERADGEATLAWLRDRPWYPGVVGMFGPSYLGLTQWAVADLAPGELRALAPAVAPSSMRESVVYQHDVLALETVISWMHQVVHQELPPWRVVAAMATQRRDVGPAFAALPVARADRRAFGNEVDFFQEWLAHEAPDDPWWDPVDFRPHLTSSPPASMVTGWFDIFLPWQVRDFGALVAAGREARITIGPWTHTSPGGLGAMLRDGLDWFDTHLRGGPPSRGRGSVRLFVMGSDRWIETPSWPPPAEVTRWHLHADGRLDRDAPAASSPSRYRFDPADPPSSVGGAGLDWRTSGRRRQTEREARGDVLTFTSDALRDDVTVAGPIAADLHLRSATAHADVFVRLCVVSARGRSTNLSDGIVRLHPGTSAPAAGTETDDDVRHVRVEMWPTATTFRRGERIRLQVSGGAHPRYARNLGTGAPLATGSAMRTSEHEVRHDPAHPSCVELPVTTL